MARGQTPSQTIGPYFAYGLTAHQYGYPFSQIAGGDLVAGRPGVQGERVQIVGQVLDGAGAPVDDAMIEIWQADASGRYAHAADTRNANASFKGFGRMGTGTDPDQRFIFRTIKPGSVDGRQAPHVNLCVFARGLLTHAYTRLYFSDEGEANAADPVLNLIPEARRPTLIARRQDSEGDPVYRFDIRLQGNDETVFLEI
ncbi:MAG: protocatechuate 3,4-dioxygenase subunit alpha [Pseudomonadota bacterium]